MENFLGYVYLLLGEKIARIKYRMNQYLSEALSKTNYKKGRGEQKPLILVIHRISLPGLTAGSAISRFTDPKQEVSSHAICKYDGTIINLVRDSDTAFCNGVVVNPKSSLVKMYFQKGISINEISLSLENEGSEYADLTSEQYKANASWVKEKCIKFNIPINALHVIRHDQIRSDKTCPGKINIEKIIILASKAEPIQPDIPTSMIPATNLTPIDDRITLLSRLLELYRQLLEVLLNRDKLGNARSPGWPAFRKLHIKKNCSGCGKKGTLL